MIVVIAARGEKVSSIELPSSFVNLKTSWSIWVIGPGSYPLSIVL